jgi:large subunit ribosomal protein L9
MRVILKTEVPNLGRAGELVKVSPGYGRNFLIPRGLALAASEGNVKEAQHQQRMAEAIQRKEHSGAVALSETIQNTPVSIRRKAGEDDKLFGSVTKKDISEALAAEGIELDRRAIQLEDNIKAVGLYNVPVRLTSDVTAEIRVYVIRA